MIELIHGDAVSEMKKIATGSIDAVLTDPPYPCVKRDYGYFNEQEWMELIQAATHEIMRVLRPRGSAMILLQPNSKHIGEMRSSIWDYLSWVCKEYNVVQDAYWWNIATLPSQHVMGTNGLMRPSLKYCIWLGSADCYRNQDAVLWTESQGNAAGRVAKRAKHGREYFPSGSSMDRDKGSNAAVARGGVTPFNVLPMYNGGSKGVGGEFGHSAATPPALLTWWMSYISKPGDTILDPFSGSFTSGVVAKVLGRNFIGIEKNKDYYEIGLIRLGGE